MAGSGFKSTCVFLFLKMMGVFWYIGYGSTRHSHKKKPLGSTQPPVAGALAKNIRQMRNYMCHQRAPQATIEAAQFVNFIAICTGLVLPILFQTNPSNGGNDLSQFDLRSYCFEMGLVLQPPTDTFSGFQECKLFEK